MSAAGPERTLDTAALRQLSGAMTTEFVEAKCISNAAYLSGEGFRTDGVLINLTIGKTYRARFDADGAWIRVWDDFGEDYLYPIRMFELVSASGNAPGEKQT